jgi:hypothetical protein
MHGSLSHPLALSRTNCALFNACPGKTPSWWSDARLAGLTCTANASWYDSAVEPGNPPFSGDCQGSYQAQDAIDSSWHTRLDTAAGFCGVPRSPELAVSSYVRAYQFGTCTPDEVEVLADAIAGGLDSPHLAQTRLPVATLWRAGRRLDVPISVSYAGTVPSAGLQDSAPGAVSRVSLHWQGSIAFARAYTRTPNGCRLPPYLTAAERRPQSADAPGRTGPPRNGAS